VRTDLVNRVLEKLEVDVPAPDLGGLCLLYSAWCQSVPFDNVLKLIYVAEGRTGPFPGATAEGFFRSWLGHGVGGTCWAGNGALHDLLESLGFEVTRAIATGLPSPHTPGPNHGSVIVTLEGERWIVDASILSGEPIRIASPEERLGVGPLPRFFWLDGQPAVLWRSLGAPEGFPCRIDRVGALREEWDALYERTRGGSFFNYQLNARIMRGPKSIGASGGRRFSFDDDGSLTSSPLDRDGRIRFLVDELGVAEEIAAQVPDDREVSFLARHGHQLRVAVMPRQSRR
jgi:N-hydroxyarylamine O-acetyltransferase